MTNYTNCWIVERRKLLIKAFGEECEFCGGKEKLQFAHREPTELSGEGRGRKERYYDVINNPCCYVLLCKKCHDVLDGRLRHN